MCSVLNSDSENVNLAVKQDYIVEEQEKRNQAYLRQPAAACKKSLSACEMLRKARVGGRGDGNS